MCRTENKSPPESTVLPTCRTVAANYGRQKRTIFEITGPRFLDLPVAAERIKQSKDRIITQSLPHSIFLHVNLLLVVIFGQSNYSRND